MVVVWVIVRRSIGSCSTSKKVCEAFSGLTQDSGSRWNWSHAGVKKKKKKKEKQSEGLAGSAGARRNGRGGEIYSMTGRRHLGRHQCAC